MSANAKRLFSLRMLLEMNEWRWPPKLVYETQCRIREQAAYLIGWQA